MNLRVDRRPLSSLSLLCYPVHHSTIGNNLQEKNKFLSKAEEGTRTLDLRITNATRYQLRHFGLRSCKTIDYYIFFSCILQSFSYFFLKIFFLHFFQKDVKVVLRKSIAYIFLSVCNSFNLRFPIPHNNYRRLYDLRNF